MKTTLFLPYTQYHMLLNYAIAAKNGCDNHNIMILTSNTQSKIQCQKILSSFFPDIKMCVYMLDATDKVNNLKMIPIKKRNMRTIDEILNVNPPVSKFYYSCERHLYTAYLLHLLKNSAAELHFVEDGIITYTEKEWIAKKNFFEKLGDRLIYGAWHDSGDVQGQMAGGSVSEFAEALSPQYLPDNFGAMQKNRIDNTAILKKLRFENIPTELNKLVSRNINVIIALDSNTYCNDEYIGLMRSYVEKAIAKDLNVAIKKHPDDTENKELSKKLSISGNVTELPAYLPIEIYYLLFHRTLKNVVGSLSTAMITAKWLLPKVEVVSVCNKTMLATKNIDAVFELFDKYGIKIEKV